MPLVDMCANIGAQHEALGVRSSSVLDVHALGLTSPPRFTYQVLSFPSRQDEARKVNVSLIEVAPLYGGTDGL